MKVQHQWNITEVNPQLVREKKICRYIILSTTDFTWSGLREKKPGSPRAKAKIKLNLAQ